MSGGGARAFAEIGVLLALEEEGIPIDCIAGNSMGALLGGLYAAGVPAARLKELAHDLDLFRPPTAYANLSVFQKQLVRPAAFGIHFDGLEYRLPRSLLSDAELNWLVVSNTAEAQLLSGGDFDRLPVPFRAVALDLQSGNVEVFRSGDLARAIRSSISVPVTLPPIRTRNQVLVDAGPKDNLPIWLAREMGADRVIAVNCTQALGDHGALDDAAEVALRLVRILSESVDSTRVTGWDVWIEPTIAGVQMNRYDLADSMIAEGYRATRARMSGIRALLGDAPPHPPRRLLPAPPERRVAWVRLQGRRLAYSWVPRRELGFEPGDAFSLEKLGRGLMRLGATGLYESIWPRLSLEEDGRVGITLELEERTPARLSLGFLYDNSRLVNVDLELERANLLRLGETAYLDAAVGNYRNGIEAGVRSGRLRGVPLAMNLRADARRIRERRRDGGEFLRQQRGAEFSAGLVAVREALLLAGISVRRDEGRSVGGTAPEQLHLPSNWTSTERSLFARLLIDGTDQGYLPSTGLRARMGYAFHFRRDLSLSHQEYAGDASLAGSLGRWSLSGAVSAAGVTRERLEFRYRHRLDLTRETLGRFESSLFAPFAASQTMTAGFRLAPELYVWAEGRAGLLSDTWDGLWEQAARHGLQGGILQRTPVGPVLLGSAAEKDRGPFYFIQVGHNLLPEQ